MKISSFFALLFGILVVQNLSAQRVFKDCPDCSEMVVLPAGSFLMGSAPGGSLDQLRGFERPRHRVRIESFAIGKYEVTQAQWYSIMGNNPSENRGRTLPVELVSWNDVQQFITNLNQKTGQKYRLPSEAEWEYAARAGASSEWSFGNDELMLGDYAWYEENSEGKTQKVGQKLPNAFGLFDMQGNVWEWVQDCWHEGYVGAPKDGKTWTSGCIKNYRVIRGGSFDGTSFNARPAFRTFNADDSVDANLGFRLAHDR